MNTLQTSQFGSDFLVQESVICSKRIENMRVKREHTDVSCWKWMLITSSKENAGKTCKFISCLPLQISRSNIFEGTVTLRIGSTASFQVRIVTQAENFRYL